MITDEQLREMCKRLISRWYNIRIDWPDIDETELVLDAKAVARWALARLDAKPVLPQAISGALRWFDDRKDSSAAVNPADFKNAYTHLDNCLRYITQQAQQWPTLKRHDISRALTTNTLTADELDGLKMRLDGVDGYDCSISDNEVFRLLATISARDATIAELKGEVEELNKARDALRDRADKATADNAVLREALRKLAAYSVKQIPTAELYRSDAWERQFKMFQHEAREALRAGEG